MASTRDIQNFIPKEVESDKAAYWQMRDQLLKKYKGQWVAIYQGQIISAGDDLFKLTEEVYDKGCKYAYINRVGEEDTTIFKIRRKEYPYNTEYRPFPLPEASVTFSNLTRTKQKEVMVIPDTGADLTSLLAEDCIDIGVVETPPYITGIRTKGYGGQFRETVLYRGIANINGIEKRCLIDLAPEGETERLLGRDVLNQLYVSFRGPENKVVFEEQIG